VLGDESAKETSGFSQIPMTVDVTSFLGSHVRSLLKHDGKLNLQAVSMDTDRVFRAGDRITAAVAHHNAQLLKT
jgi:hypothetical protein